MAERDRNRNRHRRNRPSRPRGAERIEEIYNAEMGSCREIVRRALDRSRGLGFEYVKNLCLALVVLVILVVFVVYKGNSVPIDSYSEIKDGVYSICVPVFLAVMAITLVLTVIGAGQRYILAVVSLIEIGVMLQCILIATPKAYLTADKILISLVVCTVLGFVLALAIQIVLKYEGIAKWGWFLLVLDVILAGVGFLENMDKLKLRFMLPEVVKYVSIILLALILTHRELSDRKKYRWSMLLFFAQSAVYGIISEFGTMLICWVVFFGLFILMLPRKYVFRTGVIVLTLTMVGISVTRSCWEVTYPEKVKWVAAKEEYDKVLEENESESDIARTKKLELDLAAEELKLWRAEFKVKAAEEKENAKNAQKAEAQAAEQAQSTEQSVPADPNAPPDPSETFVPIPLNPSLIKKTELTEAMEKLEELKSSQKELVKQWKASGVELPEGWDGSEIKVPERTKQPNRLEEMGGNIYGKMWTRFYDKDNFQFRQAQNAQAMAGALGTNYPAPVINIQNDYIFLLLLAKMGALMGMVVLAIYTLFFYESCELSLRGLVESERVLAVGFALCLIAQAFLSAASAGGVIPTVGLGMPFMAKGMSGETICFAQIFGIALAGRHQMFYLQQIDREKGWRQ